MRFTDGYWQLRPGVDVLRPRDVDAVEAGDDTLTVYAPTAPITKRGDTLNRPVVTVTFDAPADDVIGVRIEHHQGRRDPGPHFAVNREPGVVKVVAPTAPGEGPAELTSGGLTARVSTDGAWQVDFVAGGEVLTTSSARSVGLASTPEGDFVHEQLGLSVGEHVYGLGERFGAFVKNGQSVDVWNEDGGTASEQAYKNVPFYLTDRGYGVFVAHPENVSFEVGSEAVSRTQFSVPGQTLQYYVIHGPTPAEILRRYTALTGRPAVVPAWSYGLWLSTSFTTDYSESTVMSFVDGMAERDIPLSVFHFDCFWMRQFHWCDFVWDPATFPDPEGMLERLHDRGLKVCVWINPYIAQRSHLFREGKAKGYLVTTADGDVWQWDKWQAGMALVDFTNPDAAAWYQDKLRVLLDQGVDCFKTDFGERIPTDVVWHDGSDPQRMHNFYASLYNKTVFDLLEQERGTGEAVLFARSATAGTQAFPVHWGGDCESTFVSMAESLRGGLSLSLSGFGYWSHDIGGFEGTPDPAVFKRWTAFGLLSSHSRLHGSSSYRVPWAFDDEAVDVTRKFTRLKMRLMPYLGGAGAEAAGAGLPVMRPMVLEFPADRSAATVDTQYMLGSSLLVAPVFGESRAEYYLPAGEWTRLAEVAASDLAPTVSGSRWVTEEHGFDTLPVLVRPGTVLPVGARDDRPDYAWAEGVTLRCTRLPEGFDEEILVPGGTGAPATFRVRYVSGVVHVTSADAPGEWSVENEGKTVRATGPGEVAL
ncbi:alpha-xylosidase [Promicromonospora sukumoe]|uniref:alpha-D-xyloside xylohydrolase n=1 Tax=Promicromonospora sukumoe TaxID=88382 RepID=A0A7W3PFG5_9MICO|nr:alpha-xylosidase [Promicromonospora sukumoe]MBA8809908.1 alpha-D-xyloside xylohydrolase [Promicromonospora sukumoe]